MRNSDLELQVPTKDQAAPHLWKGTGQTAHVSCIYFIVIWPGFDAAARLIPATLQRDMLYDEQAPSSCSFDQHFWNMPVLFKTESQADKVAFIVCIILIICIILILSLIPIILNVFIILQVPLQRELLSRKFQCWTRTLFIWSTTFSGLWDSRQRRRQRRLYQLQIIHLLFSNISIISLVLIIS